MMSLLERGADVNTVESVKRSTILHCACEKGCEDIVELLLKYNADVNRKNSQGRTPLMEACKNGHKEIVKILLRR